MIRSLQEFTVNYSHQFLTISWWFGWLILVVEIIIHVYMHKTFSRLVHVKVCTHLNLSRKLISHNNRVVTCHVCSTSSIPLQEVGVHQLLVMTEDTSTTISYALRRIHGVISWEHGRDPKSQSTFWSRLNSWPSKNVLDPSLQVFAARWSTVACLDSKKRLHPLKKNKEKALKHCNLNRTPVPIKAPLLHPLCPELLPLPARDLIKNRGGL